MYLIIVIWTIGWTASINGPVMPLYVESLGIGIVGWGLLAASAALGMFVLEWVWGALYDRVDLRVLMISSVLIIVGNLIADLVYGIVDPRVRYD